MPDERGRQALWARDGMWAMLGRTGLFVASSLMAVVLIVMAVWEWRSRSQGRADEAAR